MKLRLFLFFLGIVFLGAAFLWLIFGPRKEPQVIQVNPSPGSLETSLTPDVFVVFDQKIKTLPSLVSQPPIEASPRLSTDGKTLFFSLGKPLSSDTTYIFTLKTKKPVVWQFKTKREETQNEERLRKLFEEDVKKYYEARPEIEILNKILKELPYSTTNFRIEYSYSTNRFSFTLCREPFEETKKEVLAWFEKRGLKDLSSLKVVWLYGCGPLPYVPNSLPKP